MIVKEQTGTSAVGSIPQKRRIITDILIFTFSLVVASGLIILYLRLTADHCLFGVGKWWWSFIHRISALLSLIFTIPHIIKNRKWYKGTVRKKFNKRDNNSFQLSFLFSLTILSIIVLAFQRSVILYEYLHSIVGIITTYLLCLHTIRKYKK